MTPNPQLPPLTFHHLHPSFPPLSEIVQRYNFTRTERKIVSTDLKKDNVEKETREYDAAENNKRLASAKSQYKRVRGCQILI